MRLPDVSGHWGRSDAKSVPIFAMTANAFAEDVQKSRKPVECSYI